MPEGAITAEDRKFVEVWENVSSIENYIVRFDARGDEVYERVMGPRKFQITTAERIVTEDKIVVESHNPFRNGCFRPVVVPEGVNIETNPNALSDEDIQAIFRSRDEIWDEWIVLIDSPATLQRMMDLADRGDADIAHRRYLQLKERLDGVKPKRRISQRDDYESVDGPETKGDDRGSRRRVAMKS